MSNGASIGIYSGDILKLKDDLADLKPTFFPSVPRLYSRFYDVMTSGINKLTGVKRYLADWGISTKLKNLNNHNVYNHGIWDKIIFNKTK